jgi:hypothetical protein
MEIDILLQNYFGFYKNVVLYLKTDCKILVVFRLHLIHAILNCYLYGSSNLCKECQ